MVHEKDIFLPDPKIEKQYKEKLKMILESPEASRQGMIELGELPPIYTELGIQDKELKTNNKTILKALGINIGIQGLRLHNVPFGTMENFLVHLYDPKAVFKSLSTASNPNSYTAVLNAMSVDEKPIIAILSPSKDGKGFTFIPSVYERNNFNVFLKNVHKEKKALYIKEKGSELWGQPQSLPRHNSEPSVYSILTKNDIVKRILEKNPQNLLKNQGMREADGPVKAQKQPDQNSREMEQAKKAGYVQGVCECALVGNQTIAKKLLTEMKVNKDMAKKYAGPETYKALEQGVFAPKPEHRRELTRSRGRSL